MEESHLPGTPSAVRDTKHPQEGPKQGKNKDSWSLMFKQLAQYRRANGDCRVPTRHPPNRRLGLWVMTQRRQYTLLNEGKSSSLTFERVQALESLGFAWKVRGDKCEKSRPSKTPTLCETQPRDNSVVPQRILSNSTEDENAAKTTESKSKSLRKSTVENMEVAETEKASGPHPGNENVENHAICPNYPLNFSSANDGKNSYASMFFEWRRFPRFDVSDVPVQQQICSNLVSSPVHLLHPQHLTPSSSVSIAFPMYQTSGLEFTEKGRLSRKVISATCIDQRSYGYTQSIEKGSRL